MTDIQGERPLIALLEVGDEFALEMLPAPNHARSAISRQALADLKSRRLVSQDDQKSCALRSLRIAGQPVADLDVVVSVGPAFLRVDGILGGDFFRRFSQVRWDPQSNRVTLVP